MKYLVSKSIKYINENILFVVLSGLTLLFLVYIFSSCFRLLLSNLNIDSNFIVAYLTAFALIFSAIQNKKERKYNFNFNLKNSIEEKALVVIGKLSVIMNDSQIFLQTMKNIKRAIDERKKFVDLNNVSSLENLKKDKELVGAYITTFFSPYILEEWNLLAEKIDIIGSNCSILLLNYEENIDLIYSQNLNNEVLSNISYTIEQSEILDKEIYTLTEKMSHTLMGILKNNDKNLREKYIN